MRDDIFIVLFRGVGGKTQLPSKSLREALTQAGFHAVATYIATGNVVLASALTSDEVRARVAAAVKEKLGFTKEVIVFTRHEWAQLIAGNPFPEAADRPTTLHAFGLAEAPVPAAVEKLAARAAATERVIVKGRVLYFHAPDGFGRSKLPPIVNRTLGVVTTARNWNTVLALARLAEGAAAP